MKICLRLRTFMSEVTRKVTSRTQSVTSVYNRGQGVQHIKGINKTVTTSTFRQSKWRELKLMWQRLESSSSSPPPAPIELNLSLAFTGYIGITILQQIMRRDLTEGTIKVPEIQVCDPLGLPCWRYHVCQFNGGITFTLPVTLYTGGVPGKLKAKFEKQNPAKGYLTGNFEFTDGRGSWEIEWRVNFSQQLKILGSLSIKNKFGFNVLIEGEKVTLSSSTPDSGEIQQFSDEAGNAIKVIATALGCHILSSCLRDRAANSKYTEKDGDEPSGSRNRAPTVSTATEGRAPQSYKQKIFTVCELRAATEEFSSKNMLGKGGFGAVYKVWLDEHTFAPITIDSATGIAIAVKKLELTSDQGHKQWLAEVEIMKECDHPNIIKLIGHCSEDEYHLLVYEFMPRRSLDMHLFSIYDQPLSWAIRIKVALGAAKGLAYLHRKGLLFCDIKTANVLLDSEYNAKLSGFGLARDGPAGEIQEYNAEPSDFGLAREGPAGDKSHVSSNAMGTAGSIDPRYISTGHASSETDVYSFGVLLLEMLTGKKRLEIGDTLVQLVGHYSLIRLITGNMDPNMAGTYSMQEAKAASEVACRCLSKDIKNRPTMDEVVNKLEVLHKMNGAVAWNFDRRRGNQEGTSGSK